MIGYFCGYYGNIVTYLPMAALPPIESAPSSCYGNTAIIYNKITEIMTNLIATIKHLHLPSTMSKTFTKLTKIQAGILYTLQCRYDCMSIDQLLQWYCKHVRVYDNESSV